MFVFHLIDQKAEAIFCCTLHSPLKQCHCCFIKYVEWNKFAEHIQTPIMRIKIFSFTDEECSSHNMFPTDDAIEADKSVSVQLLGKIKKKCVPFSMHQLSEFYNDSLPNKLRKKLQFNILTTSFGQFSYNNVRSSSAGFSIIHFHRWVRSCNYGIFLLLHTKSFYTT